MENEKKPGKLTRTSGESSSTGRSIASAAIKTVGAGSGRAARVEVLSELKELVKAELEITPAEFRQAEFLDAEYRPADFKPADFKQGDFHQAEYHPAQFTQAEFHPSEFRPAVFKQAEYKPAEYKDGAYHPAEFIPAVFVPAQYRPARFKPAEFKQAVFRQAQYVPAEFKQAEFKPAEFKQAQFKPAEFEEAAYTPAEYVPSEFKEAAFTPAVFKPAVVTSPEFHPSEFRPAAYTPAEYKQADFKPAEFKKGDFAPATYRPAQFHQAEFHQASYRPATFKAAEFKDAHIEGIGASIEAEGASAPQIGVWEREGVSPEGWRTQVEHGVQMERVEERSEPARRPVMQSQAQQTAVSQAQAQPARTTFPKLDPSLGALMNEWLAKELGAADSYELALGNLPEGELRTGLKALYESHGRRAATLRDWIAASEMEPARSAGIWPALSLPGRVNASHTHFLPELVASEQRVLGMYDTDLGARDPWFRSWVAAHIVPEQRKAVDYCRSLSARYSH